MSSRSKRLVRLAMGARSNTKKNDERPEVEGSDERYNLDTDMGDEGDRHSRSSELNDCQMFVADEMEQIFGDKNGSDNSIARSIHASPNCPVSVRRISKMDCNYNSSTSLDQLSLNIEKPNRRVSETESDLFSGDYSDDDPTYHPALPDSKSFDDINNEEDLITLSDLGVNSPTENSLVHLSQHPTPSTSRQNTNHDDIPYNIASIILSDILDLVWIRTKHLTRWRAANPAAWKRNVAKKRRAEGLSYITNQIVRSAKLPKAIDCSKCKFKCQDSFTDEDRKKLCRVYWGSNYVGKKNFILAHITLHSPKRVIVNRIRPRPYNSKCFLDLGMEKKQVCQKFFCTTLNISASVIHDAIKHRDELGFTLQTTDPRGLHEPFNKTLPVKVQEVIDHINSFPTMESHYVRKESQRKYLDSKLSVPKMYDLYKEKYENPVSEITYRRIFATKFNLAPFIPKKDQCLLCNKYHSAQGVQKIELENSYQEHINRKKACLNEKDNDIKRAETNKNFVTCTFDLQAILQLPCSMVGILYYVRKLTLYNLCIYETALPNNAFCFPWTEVHGKKGSAEIGTILHYYLSKCLPLNVTEVSLFSDTCSGQNRNQYVAAILLWTVNKIDNLRVIEHKFLESGHSHMEADSMHSSIEHAKKHVDVFSITDWINIFKNARAKGVYKVNGKKVKKERYQVKEFKYNEFLDLKKLAAEMIKNKTKDTAGGKINWLKIKRMKYVKGDTRIYFNYDMSEDFLVLETTTTIHHRAVRTTRRSNPNSVESVTTAEEDVILPVLKPLYDQTLSISTAKKKDLSSLCEKGVIPEEYHGWYQSLKCKNDVIDRVPDVAVEESSSDED